MSLSQLTELTGIPMRRLAEHEYEGRPLLPAEQDLLAGLFGVQRQALAGNWTAGAVARPALLPSQQAYLLAALAASAALTLALQVERPNYASAGNGIDLSLLADRPTPAVTQTSEPQATPLSALEAEALLASLLGVTPTPVADQLAVAPVPAITPEPAEPHVCPIVPEQGKVVVLRSPQASEQDLVALALAVDSDEDGYAEPASTRRASVVAAHDGVAQVMLDTWPGGNQVVVEGRDGWRSTYAHLAAVAVEPGQQVVAGQMIGQAGNTGRVAGPQLGLEIQHNGESSDPSSILDCTS
jgi:hypothetical protein